MESIYGYEGWYIVREISNDCLGPVYEIKEKSGENTRTAALKVIPIPLSEEEVESYKDVYSQEEITKQFNSLADKMFEEYKRFQKLQAHKNIVRFEDVRRILKPNGSGYNIFVRMELLQPLNEPSLMINDQTDIIAVGKDICTALKECRNVGGYHRDIRPGNIFISDDGTYKLGEFGIIKSESEIIKNRRDANNDSEDYLPPEVNNSGDYSVTSDIYSLGLVLYWLLNERRLPFLPVHEGNPTESGRLLARNTRFSSELPPPTNGSEDLKKVVLKACSLDPMSRYQKPEELYEDLRDISMKTDPPEPQPEPQPDPDPDPEPSLPPWLICLLVAAGALMILAVILMVKPPIEKNKGNEEAPVSAVEESAETSVEENTVQIGPFYSGTFEFQNGAMIIIPGGFVDVTNNSYKPVAGVEKYRYDFYNSSEQMSITLTEGNENDLKESYGNGTLWGMFGSIPAGFSGGILDVMYADEVSHYGTPVYEERNTESFLLTGYSGSDIYYTRVARLNGVIYSIDFVYPASNRKVCDQLLLDTEITFSGYPVIAGNTSSGSSNSTAYRAPSLAELQVMVDSGTVKTKSNTNASLELPKENQMLVNPFRAHVDNGKSSGSIYVMPKPENDNGHTGTIKTGEEVWIVARSGSFYFFCSDDGKIGWNGKGFFS